MGDCMEICPGLSSKSWHGGRGWKGGTTTVEWWELSDVTTKRTCKPLLDANSNKLNLKRYLWNNSGKFEQGMAIITSY